MSYPQHLQLIRLGSLLLRNPICSSQFPAGRWQPTQRVVPFRETKHHFEKRNNFLGIACTFSCTYMPALVVSYFSPRLLVPVMEIIRFASFARRTGSVLGRTLGTLPPIGSVRILSTCTWKTRSPLQLNARIIKRLRPLFQAKNGVRNPRRARKAR